MQCLDDWNILIDWFLLHSNPFGGFFMPKGLEIVYLFHKSFCSLFHWIHISFKHINWTHSWNPNRVNLGVMAIKMYFKLSGSSELERHHQIQFTIIPRTPKIPYAEDTISVFWATPTSPGNIWNWDFVLLLLNTSENIDDLHVSKRGR